MKTHYKLLGVAPDASADEIRRAFRRLIAMYHPDKVHHLGAEFQDLALERSSALTAAYRILIDPDNRVVYDRALAAAAPVSASPVASSDVPPASPASPQAVGQPPRSPQPDDRAAANSPPPADAASEGTESAYGSTCVDRDAVLKRAVLQRADRILARLCHDADRTKVPEFDLSYFSKPRLFGTSRPWLLVRFIARLDGRAIQELWTQAARAAVTRRVSVAVFVLANGVAEREIAEVIAGNSRRSDGTNRVTLVPVDVRNWRAWIPTGADRTVRSVAEGLRATT